MLSRSHIHNLATTAVRFFASFKAAATTGDVMASSFNCGFTFSDRNAFGNHFNTACTSTADGHFRNKLIAF